MVHLSSGDQNAPADPFERTPLLLGFGPRDWIASVLWAIVIAAASRAHDVFAPGVSSTTWAGSLWIGGLPAVTILVGVIVAFQLDRRIGPSRWVRRWMVGFLLSMVFDFVPALWTLVLFGLRNLTS